MSQGTYLQQIARRATQDTAGLLRPRRLMHPLSPTVPDEPADTTRTALAGASREEAVASVEDLTRPPAPAQVSAPSSAAQLGAAPVLNADAETTPEAMTVPVIAAPAPRAGVGFVPVVPREGVPAVPDAAEGASPGDAIRLARTLPSVNAAPPAVDAAPPVVDVAAPGLEPAQVPREPRRRLAQRRNASAALDPLAVALATAVRWTSSDERPDSPAATHVERERPAAAASRREGSMAGSASTLPVGDPTRPRRMPELDGGAGAVTRSGNSNALPVAERFTGIHIGSVEVEILTPPAPVTPQAPRLPVASSAVSATSLARGLTSTLGLRQS